MRGRSGLRRRGQHALAYAPTLSARSPTSGPAQAETTVTFTGTNFTDRTVIREHSGIEFDTLFVSSTSVTAVVPISVSTWLGAHQLEAYTPPPGGGTTTTLQFNADYPLPTVSALTPATQASGGGAFDMIITGTGYYRPGLFGGANAYIDGVYVEKLDGGGNPTSATVPVTTPVDAPFGAYDPANPTRSLIQVSVRVPIEVADTPGTYSITIVNPAPGGGTSNALTLTIT